MSDDLELALTKVTAREELNPHDWRALTKGHDLIALGVAADEAKRRRHDDRVTFVQLVSVELDSDGSEWPAEATPGEVRLCGTPSDTTAAVGAVRHAVERAGGVPVTGFAVGDLERLCDHDQTRLGELLGMFRKAGMAMVSELEAHQVRDIETTLETFRANGMMVSRLTVGSASPDAAFGLMRRLRTWSGLGEVCCSFAPLATIETTPPTTGYTDLRQVALARLLVDNIDSIQVDWSRHGPKLAQVALTFGADDVDAVPAVASPSQGWRRAPQEEIQRNITAAGFRAVRRNGRFEAL